jgi:hypothetical protein
MWSLLTTYAELQEQRNDLKMGFIMKREAECKVSSLQPDHVRSEEACSTESAERVSKLALVKEIGEHRSQCCSWGQYPQGCSSGLIKL